MMQMIMRFHMLEPFVALSELMTRIGSRCALGKARSLLNEVWQKLHRYVYEIAESGVKQIIA